MTVPTQRREPGAAPHVQDARIYLGSLDALDSLSRGEPVDQGTLEILVAAAYAGRQRFRAALLDDGVLAALPPTAPGVEIAGLGRNIATVQVAHDWLWRLAVTIAGRVDLMERAFEEEMSHV